jgi:two-component system, cell cycle response regulator DivK
MRPLWGAHKIRSEARSMLDHEKAGTILYVEDNPENRLLVRRVLMAEGYTVIEAADAPSAFSQLEQTVPNLILMDISMPGIDGYTLTAEFRKLPQLDQVPIVALTANVMKGDKERSIQAGCDGYLQKPIDIDTLVVQVERFLNMKK